MNQKPEPPAADFPSLAAAATTKTKKKNKPQTLSLADFNSLSAADSKPKNTAAAEPKRLTEDEKLMLPTGPRERAEDEMERNRIGGGFRNYGGERGGRGAENRRENANRERVELGPSRADEVDDWSKTKKFNAFGNGPGERREKGGFFNSSRADEVDNWSSKKSFVGDGPRRERRMGFESYSNGAGPDSENWLRKKEDRVGNGMEGDTWGRRESNGLGSESNERPKLKLQPRTLPVAREEGGAEGKVKGANPFGAARPREDVLKEKGKDWKEMEEKYEAGKRNGERSEGFGRRRGFGIGKSESGEERSWRKTEAGESVASPSESRF